MDRHAPCAAFREPTGANAHVGLDYALGLADPALRRHKRSTAVPHGHEQGEIIHAELSWPGGGSVVFGSTKHTDSVHGAMRPGTAAVYVFTDVVDAVYNRVHHAECGTVVRPPSKTQFGSGVDTYAFTAGDPEGNLWTFGTYRGSR